jgi:mono/diheme cytochrome c family protein
MKHPLVARTAALAALVLPCLFTAPPAWSADADTLAVGQRVYQHWCLPCHGSEPGRYGIGQTGTTALQVKYDGKVPPVLDERTDLTPEFVAVFVRRGISTMPFFRRTEISDAELAALGAYLARPRNTPAAAAP